MFVSVEHDGGADERARHEKAFRNGLKRNIVHLSNVTRVNQELLARLREQVGGVFISRSLSGADLTTSPCKRCQNLATVAYSAASEYMVDGRIVIQQKVG